MRKPLAGFTLPAATDGSPEFLRNSVTALELQHRRAFLIAQISAAFLCMLSWYGRDPNDVYITWVYPIAAALFLAMFVLTLRRRELLQVTGISSMVLGAILILTRLIWHFAVGDDIEDRLMILVGGHYWGVGILLVACLVAMGTRDGLLLGGAVLLLSVAIAAWAIMPELLSGELSRQSMVYLVRVHGFLLVLLALTSAGTVVRDRLITTLTEADILDRLARTDLLSGLANRRAAQQFLGRHLSPDQRQRRPLSLILVDVDHFKHINDRYGHTRGDNAIRHVADILASGIRENDLIARWGGEEFLIIAPDTTIEQARELAERLRERLRSRNFMDTSITATFGVTQALAEESSDNLITRADQLLYQGKGNGRDQVVVG